MENEKILQVAARKAFESEAVQQSWKVHLQAFGPILEPAFAEDWQSRIDLTDALNRISRRDLQGGLDKLRPLQEKCETDADCAAWLFCVGLCFDLAGDTANMVEFYESAGEYGHRFYLPYLKLAQLYYSSREFEGAEEYFRRALECVGAEDLRSRMLRAALESNLSRCLLAMHRYPEALELLDDAEREFPKMKGLTDSRAMIYAAMGDAERCEAALERLQQENPQALEPVSRAAHGILEGRDSHYRPTRIDGGKIAAFWQWFLDREQQLRRTEQKMLTDQIARKLRPVFPELEFTPAVLAEVSAERGRVALVTGYSRSLEEGYRQVLEQRPAGLAEFWRFEILS